MFEGYHPLSLALYAFGWQYDGKRGYVEAGECVYKVEPLGYEVESWGECRPLEEVLGLNEDLSEFYEKFKDDPLVGCVVRRYLGLRPRKIGLWAGALVGIAQQNASFAQGWKMLHKLHLLASKRVEVFGRKYLLFPRPGDIDEKVLRKAGFGYRARAVLNLKEVYEELSCKNLERLKEVKGVGDYTLGVAAVLGCHNYSYLPLDRWLKALAERAYGSWKALNSFGKWKGLHALLVTVALDAVPLRRALKRLEEGKVCPYEEPSPLTLWKYLGADES